MLYVVFELARKDQDVVEVYQERLESHTGKDELQDLLKGGRGVLQSERHSKPTKGTAALEEILWVKRLLKDG